MTRFLPFIAALAVAAHALPARAQLGTSNNPPPQHLFNMGQPPAPGGDSTMAERRAKLAAAKRAHRTVHR